jgi:hypothetical protein
MNTGLSWKETSVMNPAAYKVVTDARHGEYVILVALSYRESGAGPHAEKSYFLKTGSAL